MEKKALDKVLLKKIFIVFFAFIGFLLTIKLAIIYYDANFNPYALPSFCSINDFVDCDGAAKTIHSQFLGIPLAYWGLFAYLFIIFLAFVDNLKKIKFLGFLEVLKNPLAYISALGVISFAISMGLAGLSVFEIKKICILCVVTYILNLIIAVIATDWEKGILESFKLSIKDFVNALKVRKYSITFLSLMLLASIFLSYAKLSYRFAPQVKRYEAIQKYSDIKSNPFKATGNILGDPNGKIIVYIYTDYRCPICRVYNVIIYRAAQELGGIKIMHKNLPLDSECNKNVPRPFHEGACMLARYSTAARNQGRFWEMNSELFDRQPKNEDDILKLAKSMGFDTIKLKKDANSAQTAERLNKDIKSAEDLKIDGTPSIVINGKIYTGIKPYYELKEILINAGAVEKR